MTLAQLQEELNSLNPYITRLQKSIADNEDNWTNYDPYSPISTSIMQLRYMQQYRALLEYRITVIENAGG